MATLAQMCNGTSAVLMAGLGSCYTSSTILGHSKSEQKKKDDDEAQEKLIAALDEQSPMAMRGLSDIIGQMAKSAEASERKERFQGEWDATARQDRKGDEARCEARLLVWE